MLTVARDIEGCFMLVVIDCDAFGGLKGLMKFEEFSNEVSTEVSGSSNF
jgi:hypothetical protein